MSRFEPHEDGAQKMVMTSKVQIWQTYLLLGCAGNETVPAQAVPAGSPGRLSSAPPHLRLDDLDASRPNTNVCPSHPGIHPD